MYDYYLGGKTNYTVDREAAEAIKKLFPTIETSVQVNRAYMHRALRHLARQGVRQFIDVGTGIPHAPNPHDIVQDVAPECKVVYVDNDPIVLVYADSLLDGTPEGRTAYVYAEITDPAGLLATVEGEGIIDFTRPIALSLHSLLHFIPDDQDPYSLVADLMDRLPGGSYLSLTHYTGDFAPSTWRAVTDAYKGRGTPAQVRTRADVVRFFDGLLLADPGVVVAHRWHPEPASGPSLVGDASVALYAGVARKP
ncbi:SAM-dependent methyltransferase [Streptomyces sp. LBUM 1476]|nr:SAM-dependent methyltransferase [Streptomyces sp. LBUM 1476]MBZ3916665.1 SAM-dependent methyltransferase [Streptomyces acidiscabies]